MLVGCMTQYHIINTRDIVSTMRAMAVSIMRTSTGCPLYTRWRRTYSEIISTMPIWANIIAFTTQQSTAYSSCAGPAQKCTCTYRIKKSPKGTPTHGYTHTRNHVCGLAGISADAMRFTTQSCFWLTQGDAMSMMDRREMETEEPGRWENQRTIGKY